MGWLYSEAWPTKSALIKHITDDSPHNIALAKAVRGNVLWVVFETTPDGASHVPLNGVPGLVAAAIEGRERWIGCFLLGAERDYGWGYKDMDESMGPCDASCPLKYLDMAPERDPEWRARVQAYHAKRQLTFKPKVGQRVEMVDCLIDSARIERIVGRSLIGRGSDGLLYRLSRRYIGRLLEGA